MQIEKCFSCGEKENEKNEFLTLFQSAFLHMLGVHLEFTFFGKRWKPDLPVMSKSWLLAEGNGRRRILPFSFGTVFFRHKIYRKMIAFLRTFSVHFGFFHHTIGTLIYKMQIMPQTRAKKWSEFALLEVCEERKSWIFFALSTISNGSSAVA